MASGCSGVPPPPTLVGPLLSTTLSDAKMASTSCAKELLDDLDKDADIKSNPVPAIIAERHDEERVTWITTELTPSEILRCYGGGIARRICETASVIRFVLA